MKLILVHWINLAGSMHVILTVRIKAHTEVISARLFGTPVSWLKSN